MRVLAVIPARGGSKGIPRKNLRPLAGKPLLSYSIAAGRACRHEIDLVVSTDDEEIAAFASQLGAEVCRRPALLAEDSTPLDPVIVQVVKELEARGRSYDLIATLQPTSPLLKTETIDRALDLMAERPELDTLISAKEERHLTWRRDGAGYAPNYKARVNRQLLEPVYRETGGILICRRGVLDGGSRIGPRVSLFPVSEQESVDIDSFEDWRLCEFYLNKKKIAIVLHGNSEVGMGHVYNMLSLAGDLTDHEVVFMIPKEQRLAQLAVAARNFKLVEQRTDDLLSEIAELHPDVVVNDILNTDERYIRGLKSFAKLIVNFEDLGAGARVADLVFNAIYPEAELSANHYYGPQYVLLRDEFLLPLGYEVRPEVKSVLLTFGGTDPSDLTFKTLKAIYETALRRGIEIRVVTGLGYRRSSDLAEAFPKIQIFRDIKFISEQMRAADVAFTSAGRTTFEVASIGVPTVVMAQNIKETTHFFASSEFGFLNLGLGGEVPPARILEAFERLVADHPLRSEMSRTMLSHRLGEGRANVGRILREKMERL